MLNNLIKLAKHYPGSYYESYLKGLYNYWKNKPVASGFCKLIEEASIL